MFAPPEAPPWMNGLNPSQRAAAEHGDGPLLILAGAGTGKTKTLVSRVAQLIKRGVPADRIMLVTFSRRASEEMTRRLAALTDPATARQVHAGTFHALANRLLRTYGSALGLPKGFSVLDQSDAADVMNLVRNEAVSTPSGGKKKRFPRKDTLLSIYSRVVNEQVPLDVVLGKAFPWCIPEAEAIGHVFSAYTERKRAQDALDYDDMLLFWRAAAQHPVVGPLLADLYDHVLVDEYQDTNVLQSDILRALRRSCDNITVVGDDAQSIYSFRAATVRNILDFDQQFTGAHIVTLEQNYRSTQPILDLANDVIAEVGEGLRKSLWAENTAGAKPMLATCPDERAQSDAVCDNVLRLLEDDLPLRDQAVLFRAAHHSDALEVELRRRNIPFVKYGGLKFLEAAHVRDLLALLRILDNPFDELAWFRALQLAEHVGSASAQRIMSTIGVQPRTDSGISPLVRFVEDPSAAAPRARKELTALAEALTQCGDQLTPGAQVERLREAIDPMLRRRYDNAEVRLRDLEQLGHLAADYPSRARLVAELTLDPPTSTQDLAGPPLMDDDYLTLSTVHSAKGGEWRAVHILHAADGMFPSDMATGDNESIDEERRLFYVALTRAREHLHIYTPLRYHHTAGGWGDAHTFAQRTRFLPPSLDHRLDIRAVRSADADQAITTLDLPSMVNGIDDSLRALWGPRG